jgi:putative ABC transport system permease protein
MVPRVFRRLYCLLRSRKLESELLEELSCHRAMLERHRGTEAGRVMGNATLAREDARAVWISPGLESLLRDAAYAVRMFIREPGFALVALATLGAAIGLNTSLLTALSAMVRQPWHVKDPARVVRVVLQRADGYRFDAFPGPEYYHLAKLARSFEGLVAMDRATLRFGESDARVHYVSWNYLETLGAGIERGRSLVEADDRPESTERVAVISHRAWERRFAKSEDIIGKEIHLNGVPFTVVGVVAAGFASDDIEDRDVWVPLSLEGFLDPVRAGGGRRELRLAGRLAPGVSREQARAEIDALSARYRSDHQDRYGSSSKGRQERVVLLKATYGVGYSSFVMMFLGVLLVLVLACANVGNLLLARSIARGREMAVRVSLGAGRARLVRQLLTESLVLAGAAGLLGVAIASVLPSFILTTLIRRSDPAADLALDVQPDGLVVALTAALTLLTCIGFGLVPALRASQVDPVGALKSSGGEARLRLLVRGSLLSLQVAISVMLMACAGLLFRGVDYAGKRDMGFAFKDVSLISFDLPASHQAAQVQDFAHRMSEAVAALPQADRVGFTTRAPFAWTAAPGARTYLPGENPDQARFVATVSVDRGYFGVLRIPILAGRPFQSTDDSVVLINEAMAKLFWPNENPVGKSALVGGVSRDVIAVVKDVDTDAAPWLGLEPVRPRVYRPLDASRLGRPPEILVRDSEQQLSQAIAATAIRIEPRARIRVGPLSRNFDQGLSGSRIGASIAGLLGVVALIMAAVGVSGVFSYVVRQRTREIGIRMALGGQPGRIISAVLATAWRALGIGVLAGLAGSIVGSRVLRSALYGLSPLDPAPYAAVVMILGVVALAATYLPVRRALRVDPTIALRSD